MSGLLFIGVLIVAVVILDALAQRFGVDSRSDSNDPHAPIRGISI